MARLRRTRSSNDPGLTVAVPCGAFVLLAVVSATWILPRIPIDLPLAPSADPPPLEQLRLAWFPSFDDIIDVTIVAQGNHARLVGERWRRARFRHFERGDLVERTERTLSVDATADLEHLLFRVRFWERATDCHEPVEDGAYWFTEAGRGGEVKRIVAWNCDDLLPLPISLLALAGLDRQGPR